MLKKTERLRKEKEFKKVYKQGKIIRGIFLELVFLKNKQTNPRFGIVVSNKKIAKAVKRNYNKRIIRAVIKKSAILKNKEKFDVVFRLNEEINESNKKEAQKEIELMLSRVK